MRRLLLTTCLGFTALAAASAQAPPIAPPLAPPLAPPMAPPLGPPMAPPGLAPVVPPVIAAPAPAPAAGVPQGMDPALWGHLQNWEAVMKGAQNFYTLGKLTREDKVRNKKRDFETSIMCSMPSKARLRIEAIPAPGAKPDPDDYTAYIATGTAIVEYEGADKRVTETRLRPGTAKGMLLLDFMSGAITARAAAERFTIATVKEDANFLYLELRPRTDLDRTDFESMILVLFRNVLDQPAYLPRQVVIRRQNGQQQETWDFPKPAINVAGIKPEYFEPVKMPAPWTSIVKDAPQTPLARPPLTVAVPGSNPVVVPAPGAQPPKQ